MTLGDEDLDIDGSMGHEAHYGSGEESEPEEEQEEEQQAESEPAPARAHSPQPIPQVTQQPDKSFVEKYKMIRGALSVLDGDENILNQVAYGLAMANHSEMSEIKSEIEKAKDSIFFNTPVGRDVAKLMREVPGLGKEQALIMVQKSKVAMEKSKSKPKGGSDPQLSRHDRRVAATLKINEGDYIKELKDVAAGKGVDYTYTKYGELIIENI